MLDFLDSIALAGALGAIAASLGAFLNASPRMRIGAGAAIGVWAAIAASLTAIADQRPAVFGLVFSVPLLVVGIAAASSPGFRRALMSLPPPVLIRLNAVRVLGVFFLVLLVQGRLGGPFPYFAGIGDIVTGAFAFAIAAGWERDGFAGRTRAFWWNVFGTADLVLAVVLGVTSRNGSPLQLIHAGVGSAAITTLPWSLIPLALVPFFLITHATIFAHLRDDVSVPVTKARTSAA